MVKLIGLMVGLTSPLLDTIAYSSKGSVGSAVGKKEPLNHGVIKTENKAIVRQMIR